MCSVSRERLYAVYNSMIARCYNAKAKNYFRYGGRGISVCDEWRSSYNAFKEWAYSNGYCDNADRGVCTIDRIDNDGDYTPDNCRWVDMKTQRANQHKAYTFTPKPPDFKGNGGQKPRTILWTIDGETKSAIEWCEIYGVSVPFAMYRVNKKSMSPKDALQTPKANQGRGRTCSVTGAPEKKSDRRELALKAQTQQKRTVRPGEGNGLSEKRHS